MLDVPSMEGLGACIELAVTCQIASQRLDMFTGKAAIWKRIAARSRYYQVGLAMAMHGCDVTPFDHGRSSLALALEA